MIRAYAEQHVDGLRHVLRPSRRPRTRRGAARESPLLQAALRPGVSSDIERGVEDGSIRPCNPKLAAFVIAGALNGIADWYRPGGDLPVETIADEFALRLLKGLQRAQPNRLRRQSQIEAQSENHEPRRSLARRERKDVALIALAGCSQRRGRATRRSGARPCRPATKPALSARARRRSLFCGPKVFSFRGKKILRVRGRLVARGRPKAQFQTPYPSARSQRLPVGSSRKRLSCKRRYEPLQRRWRRPKSEKPDPSRP